MTGVTARYLALAVALCCGAGAASASQVEKLLTRELRQRQLCATLDFEDMEVNVEEGIVERSTDGRDRVRAGEALRLVEVDVDDNGLDVEIEVATPRTRDSTVDVDLVFYRPIRAERGRLVNLEDLWKALAYFTVDCRSGKSVGSE